MARKSAFTLVELLIVVGIIALLITLIMPSLGRAKDLAKKTVCAAQLKTYGNQMLLFVEDRDSYPHMGTILGPGGWGWPKFYGILEAMKFPADNKVWSRWNYGEWELDECWDKAFCPAMDYVRIIRAADAAPDGTILHKTSLHRVAAGYQWNVTLRAKGVPTSLFRSGRWPTAAWHPTSGWSAWDNTMWIDYFLELADGQAYIAQAVKPDEVKRPANVAEAWDSCDFQTGPEVSWASTGDWSWENLGPGWHVGPQSENCRGWALLNGARHPGSPNILYADNHVSADATKDVPLNEVGPPPGGATWKGAKLKSWENFDGVFGTMINIVPERTIQASPG
jgi:prepilin-type processing-associated H-X9-DG protein/prepilin-type N-terminal cleavage/methylation domain-containing protein